jgi:3-deoxy-D-manno-octulosonic-acid transferase
MMAAYAAMTNLCAPLVRSCLRRRARAGKEDVSRLSERFGVAGKSRPEGPLVWMHAASVGEALSVLPLASLLLARYPGCFMLLTTGTVASARLAEARLPAGAAHQYVPCDVASWTRRFLAHWRPDLAFFTESELWPCLLAETARRCPVVLLNGRMSDKSYRNWRRVPRIAARIAACFSRVYAQDASYVPKFEGIGCRDVRLLGNLKYGAPALPADADALAVLRAESGSRPVWVAASVRPGEEDAVLYAHRRLREAYPDVLTVLAPRHPAVGREIYGRYRGGGIGMALRSEGACVADDTGVYVADTMGELGLFYRLASVAFVGGSLVPLGGQNPLEAAKLGCAVLFGPHTENFAEIAGELAAAGAAWRVSDKEELADALEKALGDDSGRRERAARASAFVEEKAGVTARHLEDCRDLLEGIGRADDG